MDEALAYFNKAIQSNANYGDAYNNRGVIRARKNQMPEALSDFNTSVKLSPDYANAWFNLGNALVETKDSARGIDDMEKAANFYLKQGNRDGYDHVEERIKLIHP